MQGTDGLFDNLFTKEIVEIVYSNSNMKAKDLATLLANKAFEFSNSKRDSPFVYNAKKHGYIYRGGKPDDITVLVAKVTEKKTEETKSEAKGVQTPTAKL